MREGFLEEVTSKLALESRNMSDWKVGLGRQGNREF